MPERLPVSMVATLAPDCGLWYGNTMPDLHSTEVRWVLAGVAIVLCTLTLSALLGGGVMAGAGGSSDAGLGVGLGMALGRPPSTVPPPPNRPCP